MQFPGNQLIFFVDMKKRLASQYVMQNHLNVHYIIIPYVK